jgi:hypothetical protein
MNPNMLKLSISTPQPRLNETFYFQLGISNLKAEIFGPLAAEIKTQTEIVSVKNGITTMRISSHAQSEQQFSVMKIADEIGQFEAGPLMFELNGTKYTTNKINYEIIDLLPAIDKGLWFRKVMLDKKLFCIIIEQRIPIPKNSKTKDEFTAAAYRTQDLPFVEFKTINYSRDVIPGLKFKQGRGSTDVDTVTINGKKKSCNYNYSISHYEIIDPKANIKLTKENFDNIPADYDFEDILIQ